MNRRKVPLTLAAVGVAVALFAATPASAGNGGEPTPGSCGLGKSNAHGAIQDQTGPGASEAAKFPPSEAGCTGNG
jgi:hypothetical protein